MITVLGGNVRLDASFNAGGDTVLLSGERGNYTATLSGSVVTIAGHDISIAIPVGSHGILVQFSEAGHTLVFDSSTGQVLFGGQVVASSTGAVQAAVQSATVFEVKALASDGDAEFLDSWLSDAAYHVGIVPKLHWALGADHNVSNDMHRFEFNDTFSFA